MNITDRKYLDLVDTVLQLNCRKTPHQYMEASNQFVKRILDNLPKRESLVNFEEEEDGNDKSNGIYKNYIYCDFTKMNKI